GLATLAHDELVPEVERRAGAVESGADVRGRGRRADAHGKRQAKLSTTASASSSTAGSAMRSTASGSFSPWPVTTTTTVPDAPTFVTAARPAAPAGPQQIPRRAAGAPP